jgi:hypothetical protein
MRSPLFLVAVLAAAVPAAAAPAQVIIIRHGEKPASGPDLDEQGYARAQALVDFFEHAPSVTRFGPPAAIYAMDPKDADGSQRPIETVTPLADALHLAIDADYKREKIPELVHDVMTNAAADGRTVLICWEHKAIPDIARAFGVASPPDWKGKVFDRAWVLTYKGTVEGSAVWDFADVPEHVLPGDSSD